MKIDVIVPSRGHPLRLMSVLMAFDALASGEHEVIYHVICDMDDALTWKAVQSLPLQTLADIGNGPLAPRMNAAALQSTADLITTAADDTFPLAQHWDKIMVLGLEHDHHCFSWQEANDPTNQTMLAFSQKWLCATGRMLPEYFPFWFGDTWVAEVYEMAFCKPLPIINSLPWGGKRGKTKGMRDLAFWFRFFAATRKERIAEARALCFAFGMPFQMPDDMLADMLLRDQEQMKRVPQYEEWFGANQGDVTEEYTRYRQRADYWLTTHQEIP